MPDELTALRVTVWEDVIRQLDEIVFGCRRTTTGNAADLIQMVRTAVDAFRADAYSEGYSDGYEAGHESGAAWHDA